MNQRAFMSCLVFVLAGPGWAPAAPYEVVKSFDATSTPMGMTPAPDGSLFGTTCNGGTYNQGSVYKLSWNGSSWVRTIVHSFNESVHGGCPQGLLLLASDGAFWGTTLYNSGIYRVTPSGSFSRIHT